MPIVEQFDCPYCMTKSSGFQVVGGHSRKSNPERNIQNGQITYNYEDWFLLSCGNCKKCITATYKFHKVSGDRQLASILASHGALRDHNYTYMDHAPKQTTVGEPEFVPENVIIPFRQAVANVASSNWDAAGTMARKTLEVATKDIVRRELPPAEQDKLIRQTWLKGRITRLYELGHLTKPLAELATRIKDEGDEAAHDENPYGETEARELLGYAQALLTYLYTIPGMVRQVREQFEQSDRSEDPT